MQSQNLIFKVAKNNGIFYNNYYTLFNLLVNASQLIILFLKK
jgi:hypothetical protein